MRVVAIKVRGDSKYAGFDGFNGQPGQRRRHGEVFDWPDGVPLASWVIPEGKPIPDPVGETKIHGRKLTEVMTLRDAGKVPELPIISPTPAAAPTAAPEISVKRKSQGQGQKS